MMKNLALLLALALTAAALHPGVCHAQTSKRQRYPLNPEALKTNAGKVAADFSGKSDWKNAQILYYAVPAMSDIKRLPDTYPVDGKPAGVLEIVAARGEFEPASFMVYPRTGADKFELKVSDLKNEEGDVIPASALDLKLVKIWYQCGAGWFGYMADPLRRTLTPELLVNDENLIWADPSTEDNYARYNNADGSVHYEWISADFMVTNYKFSNMVRIAMLKDADTLQPVVLNPGEFKQFLLTAHVPKTAKGGIYSGFITMTADGKNAGKIPVSLGVLPFELPEPATNYDIHKKFYLSLYGTAGAQGHPRIIRNLVNHNASHVGGVPELTDPAKEEQFVQEIKLAKKYGVATRPLFFNGPYANLCFWGKAMNDKQKADLKNLQEKFNTVAAICKKHLGHTDIYCYGRDEGDYATIRAERPTWRAAHAAGLKIMVSTQDQKRMLYGLDFMLLPRMPSEERATMVRKFHESHPNGLAGWYADPHSGPENPDYFRRIHGLNAYKANYDFSSNYTWYRNDWNDFAIAYESNYRGIIMVYAIRDRILDTLAWEGVREGIDDIRYATKLKLLALQAEKSANADTLLLGRKALGFIAYWDVKNSPDTFRMECVNYILQLEKALKKEQKS